MYQANFNATGVRSSTGDRPVKKRPMPGSGQATLASTSFGREVSVEQRPLAKRVKRQAEYDNPVIADLRDKSCKMAETGSAGQNSLTKPAQNIFIGNREYTRQELVKIPVKALNLLLKKEESEEIKKQVKYIRRIEKNRTHQIAARKKQKVKDQTILNEMGMLKSENNRLELENKSLIKKKNRLKLEKKSLVLEKNRLVLEKKMLVSEKNRLESENRSLITEKNRLELENRSLITERNTIWGDIKPSCKVSIRNPKDCLSVDKYILRGNK
ncbi:hypothetical protein [Endozoicomonas sp. YOMI1]|uniref:hypothetical protein n=1 Tax=Endozoicomonas sp. YOMI1 TaxID=2828739 RepID=UPI0021489D3A|nr:hypothetical protein [Endozoicomonas sp. YOMI1]